MSTQCNSNNFIFKAGLEVQGLGTRKVVANFDGGTITSDTSALLLHEIEASNHFFDDFASCFAVHREQGYLEHSVKELVAQQTTELCLGYEDTNDHDELRRDPLLATVCGKLDPTGSKRKHSRDRGHDLAGKSTLNRLETYGVERQ